MVIYPKLFFCKFFYKKIKILGYNMRAVTVYETPANSATYME